MSLIRPKPRPKYTLHQQRYENGAAVGEEKLSTYKRHLLAYEAMRGRIRAMSFFGWEVEMFKTVCLDGKVYGRDVAVCFLGKEEFNKHKLRYEEEGGYEEDFTSQLLWITKDKSL